MESLFFFISFGAGFAQLGLILFVVVALVGTRNDEDPNSERPAAIYYNAVLFVTIFAVLFAAFTIVTSLLNLSIDQPSDDFFGATSNHDGDWDAAVRALLLGAVAGGLYRVHDQRRRLRTWGALARRVRRTFLYAVSFVSVVIAAVAGVMTLWNLWEVIAPGVTNSGPRSEGLTGLASAAFLVAASSAIAWAHLREAEPDAPFSGEGTTLVVPPEPPGPPPAPARAPAPAKKAAAAKKATKKAAKRS